jgi:hypothetical protein
MSVHCDAQRREGWREREREREGREGGREGGSLHTDPNCLSPCWRGIERTSGVR